MDNDFQLLWQILIVAGGIVVFAGLLTLFVYLYLKNKEKKAKEKEVVVVDNNRWVNALGGRGNVSTFEAKGSRLIVNLIDNTKINKEELHNLGVSSIITSQDKVTLVLKEKAENIRNLLQ